MLESRGFGSSTQQRLWREVPRVTRTDSTWAVPASSRHLRSGHPGACGTSARLNKPSNRPFRIIRTTKGQSLSSPRLLSEDSILRDLLASLAYELIKLTQASDNS